MVKRTEKVDGYLENLQSERRATLAELRSLVLETVPEAVETMRYRMPTYDYRDHMVCAFASQKQYMSLYMDTDIVDSYREKLPRLDLGTSCIRLSSLDQLPLDTIRLMLEETVQLRGQDWRASVTLSSRFLQPADAQDCPQSGNTPGAERKA